MMESIVCSAIWFDVKEKHVHQPFNKPEGLTVCGLRHHNCFYVASLIKGGMRLEGRGNTQGFLTSENRFVDREEGGRIAFAAGQTTELHEELHSENLW